MHKHGLPKNLGGQVQPMHRATDKAMLADRLGLDPPGRFSLQRLANKQVPITDRGAGNGLHQAIPHAQARRRLTQPDLRQIQQNGAHFCRRLPNSSGAIGHRERACCSAFVRNQGGVTRDHLHTCHFHIELICTNLYHRGQNALPKLDFSNHQQHRLVFALNTDPGTQGTIDLQVTR